MSDHAFPTTPAPRTLLVSFTDVTHFAVTCRNMSDEEVAAFCQEYYMLTGRIIEEAGGTVIKFIGDAALIVFSEDLAETGILAIRKLKEEVDSWLKSRNHRGRLVAKVHLGLVMAGQFGRPGCQRPDVLGANVNHTAMLPSKGFALTPQAFRSLSKPSRELFKKHTLPITYIPVEERH